MDHDVTMVKVAGNGRLSIPAKQRKLVGLEDGGVVIVRVEGGELRIRPVQAVADEIQAIASEYFAGSGETVDRFLADRQKEASGGN